MLNQISIWQMVIDACLVTSILVMAFRYAKTSRAHVLLPRIVELEGRISVLMAETEGRAQHISEQLLRREQNLSKYITDIERREKDVSATIGSGEALAKELSLLCESARREAAELERGVVEARSQRVVEPPRKTQESARGASSAARMYPEEEGSADVESQKFSTRGSSRRAAEWLDDATTQEEPKDNVRSSRSSVRSLHDSYRAAEEMLKQGRAAEEVSDRTSLPIEGVQRLAQMIEIEREERSEPTQRYHAGRNPSDPRLGALGMSRRATPQA